MLFFIQLIVEIDFDQFGKKKSVKNCIIVEIFQLSEKSQESNLGALQLNVSTLYIELYWSIQFTQLFWQ